MDRFKYSHPVIEDYKDPILRELSEDASHTYITPNELVVVANDLQKQNQELVELVEECIKAFKDNNCNKAHSLLKEKLEAIRGEG